MWHIIWICIKVWLSIDLVAAGTVYTLQNNFLGEEKKCSKQK